MATGKNEVKVSYTGDITGLEKAHKKFEKIKKKAEAGEKAAAENIFTTIGKNIEKGFEGFPEKVWAKLKGAIDKTLELDFLKESSAKALKGLDKQSGAAFDALAKTLGKKKFKDLDETFKDYFKSMGGSLKEALKTAASGFSAGNILAPFLSAGKSTAKDAGGIVLKSVFGPLSADALVA